MYRDVPVCTVLYCHGTRWYKVVHDSTEAHGGIWQYKNLYNFTYWYVLEHTYSYGSIWIQLDSLLQCCQAKGAVLKTSASNHSNASSSMFQSRSFGLATASAGTPSPGRRRWRRRSGGAAAAFAAVGPGGGAAARSRLEVPRHCCRSSQRRQRGLALVRMQPC